MKRSEMIDIIDGVLIDHDLPVLQGISKEILGLIEQSGMLPPPQTFKAKREVFNKTVEWDVVRNEWELEVTITESTVVEGELNEEQS